MKISAIPAYNYSVKSNAARNQLSNSALTNIQNQDLAFKGKAWGTFGAIGGAVIGGLFAGPLGALGMATLFGGIGAGMNDKDDVDETTGYPSDNLRSTN
jgi:predicted lipid-binding transport protein (Tim44 family)